MRIKSSKETFNEFFSSASCMAGRGDEDDWAILEPEECKAE